MKLNAFFFRTHDTIIGGSGSAERQPKTQSGFSSSNSISGGNTIISNSDLNTIGGSSNSFSGSSSIGGSSNSISGSSSNGNFEGRDPFSFPNSIADIITGDDSNFVRTTRDQFQSQNQGSYTPSFGSGVSSPPAASYNGGGGGANPAPGPTSGQFK